MKKVILVLLIAVLTAGMVFAADSFSGSLTTSLAYDIDNKTLTLAGAKAWTGTATFSFSYLTKMDKTIKGGKSGQEAAAGEKPWAEIAAEWAIKFGKIDSTMTIYENVSGKTNDTSVTFPNGYAFSKSTVTFKTAKIHGVDEAWVLDLLNSFTTVDYAKSALDYKTDDDKVKYYMTFTPAVSSNLVNYSVGLSLDEIGKAQFGGKYDSQNGVAVAFAATSDEFSFVEDQVTVQGSAAAVYSKTQSVVLDVIASVKAGAAFEDVTANVAADFQMPVGATEALKADASLAASYKDAVKVDAYFATAGAGAFDAEGINDPNGKYGAGMLTEAVLSAALEADIAALHGAEDFSASLSATALNVLNLKDFDLEASGSYKDFFEATVGCIDVLNDERDIYAEASTAKLPGFVFTVGTGDVVDVESIYFSVAMDSSVVEGLTASFSLEGIKEFFALAKASYAKDAFTVAANVAYDFNGDNFDVADLGGDIKVTYAVEDICTVTAKAAYNDNTYLAKGYVAADGKLIASVEAVSTTLVEGATLSFGWKSGDLLAQTPVFGVISAAAKLAF